ncbi:MAG: hypothetical protein K2X72_40255 [Reyranella sp.]|nr:hypothetical protein [Reyranella sp.]
MAGSVVLLFLFVEAVTDKQIMTEPLAVPRTLENDGYSGVVVSRFLVDEVRAIRQSGDRPGFLSGDRLDYELTKEAVAGFRSDDAFATLATIQVPSSSLSLRSTVSMLRDFSRHSGVQGRWSVDHQTAERAGQAAGVHGLPLAGGIGGHSRRGRDAYRPRSGDPPLGAGNRPGVRSHRPGDLLPEDRPVGRVERARRFPGEDVEGRTAPTGAVHPRPL